MDTCEYCEGYYGTAGHFYHSANCPIRLLKEARQDHKQAIQSAVDAEQERCANKSFEAELITDKTLTYAERQIVSSLRQAIAAAIREGERDEQTG